MGHKHALLKPGSTGLLLSIPTGIFLHLLPPNVRHRETEVGFASGSDLPLLYPEAPSAM